MTFFSFCILLLEFFRWDQNSFLSRINFSSLLRWGPAPHTVSMPRNQEVFHAGQWEKAPLLALCGRWAPFPLVLWGSSSCTRAARRLADAWGNSLKASGVLLRAALSTALPHPVDARLHLPSGGLLASPWMPPRAMAWTHSPGSQLGLWCFSFFLTKNFSRPVSGVLPATLSCLPTVSRHWFWMVPVVPPYLPTGSKLFLTWGISEARTSCFES